MYKYASVQIQGTCAPYIARIHAARYERINKVLILTLRDVNMPSVDYQTLLSE